jgi:flagellar hook protein FlgE
MSIFNAMQSGVSGLLANSTAVGAISSNIANANTDGYRRSFSQMVTTSSANGGGYGGGVRAVSRAEISTEGTPRITGVGSDMAINGSGFFVVSRAPNEPSESNYAFTRAGSFAPDEAGNLRNAAGLYLAGFEYDSTGSLGSVERTRFRDISTVNVASEIMNGEASTTMNLGGNLPAQMTGASSTGQPFISSQDFYTPLGDTGRMEFSWTPSTTPNTWSLGVAADGTALGTVDVTFADSGVGAGLPLSYSNVVSTAPAPAAFSVDPATGQATVTLDNGTTPQVINVGLGTPGDSDGLTQFAGDYTSPQADVDGFETGQLVRFEIDEAGDLYGVFDNAARRLLYNIPLAEVANPDGLKQVNGNAYITTQQSGSFTLSAANSGSAGTITTGALESSNVDLAEELTQLIRTQRAYSSNAKIITTADEMMEETTRLKR